MYNRTCAICGRAIGRNDICGKCFKRWCCDEEGNRIPFPNWVKALIQIQSSFERKMCHNEIPFCELREDILVYEPEEFDD